MARMRRTADNEPVPERAPDPGPEVVVRDPQPTAGPEQHWTLTSYPFYEVAEEKP